MEQYAKRHTPGPWTAHEQQSKFGTLEGYYVVENGRVQIADLFGIVKGERDEDGNDVFIPTDEAAANARLIAKSLDLYDLVWGIATYPDIKKHIAAKFPGLVEKAQALISEIEGGA